MLTAHSLTLFLWQFFMEGPVYVKFLKELCRAHVSIIWFRTLPPIKEAAHFYIRLRSKVKDDSRVSGREDKTYLMSPRGKDEYSDQELHFTNPTEL